MSFPIALIVICFTVTWYYASSQNAIASQHFVQQVKRVFEEDEKNLGPGENLATMSVLSGLQIFAGLCISVPVHILFSNIAAKKGDRKSDVVMVVSKQDFAVGLLHFFGCLCTNMGFSYGSAALVQVIKLLEPIETFIFMALINVYYLRNPHGITFTKATSIFLVVLGSSLLLIQKDISTDINSHSVTFALLSGLCMASRNVIQKSKIPSTCTDPSIRAQDSNWITLISKGLTNFIKINAIAAIPSSLFIVTQWYKLQGIVPISGLNFGARAIYFHALYNLASISVLGLVSAQTHSLLNVGKRIVNVLMAAIAFHLQLKLIGVIGLSIALIGGLRYSGMLTLRSTALSEVKTRHCTLVGGLFLIIVIALRNMVYTDHVSIFFEQAQIKDGAKSWSSSKFLFLPLKLNPSQGGGMCKRTIILVAENGIVSPFHTARNSDAALTNLKGNGDDDTLCVQIQGSVGVLLDRSKAFLNSFQLEQVIAEMEEGFGVHVTYQIVERKKVAMIGWYGHTEAFIEQRNITNGNKGNYVWQYGATGLINPYTTYIYNARAEVQNNTDALVLASANVFLMNQSSSAYEAMKHPVSNLKNMVLKFDLPTIVLGIGIQVEYGDYDNISKIALHDHQRDLLKEIGKRQLGRSIAVRGDVTEMACNNAGVEKCMSMGCPSLTISQELDLGNVLEKKWNIVKEKLLNSNESSKLKLVLTLPALRPKHLLYEPIMDMLLSLYEQHDCYFILQSRYDKPQLLRYAEVEKWEMRVNITSEKVKIFSDVDRWKDFISGMDMILSTRIHGAMPGIATGTPVIIVPTDFRLLELINAMKIPALPIELVKTKKYTSLRLVMDDVEVDFELFEVNRREKLREYRRMLDDIGVQMEPSLLAILKEEQ